MLRNFYVVILIILSHFAFSQNLVPNPSFESYNGCPTAVTQLNKVNNWFNPPNHDGSPDYFNMCSTSLTVGIPNNIFGNESPATGNAYVGLSLFQIVQKNWREYIQVKLIDPLVAGTTYYVSFKYSLSDNSRTVTDDFGIYFSDTQVSGAGNYHAIHVNPQLSVSDTLDNKIGWRKIKMNYIATGGEQYIVLGNFLNDSTTTVIYVDSSSTVRGSYIYLDDISVNPSCVEINLRDDTTLCKGQTKILNATTPNATYLWQDGSTDSTYSVTQQGTYWVKVTTNCGVASDTINVYYKNVDFGSDTSLCEGEKLILQTPLISGASYSWQNNATSNTFTITNSGTYWVKIEANNCYLSDTINVTYKPLPIVDFGNDTTLCNSNKLVLDASNMGASYAWQNASSNPTYTVEQEGTYWVRATLNNCVNSDTIAITYKETPTINIGNDTTVCQNEEVILTTVQNEYTFQWQDSSTTNSFLVTKEGLYTLKASNLCGTVSKSVYVTIKDCDCRADVPTAFSPNNDGANDVLYVIGNCIESLSFFIYNRWGEKVFESHDISIGWNGTYNGKKVTPDIYNYYLTSISQTDGSEINKKGNISLIK